MYCDGRGVREGGVDGEVVYCYPRFCGEIPLKQLFWLSFSHFRAFLNKMYIFLETAAILDPGTEMLAENH